uniref:Ig-like domain-containing protein n=1 Tax=Poecilia formosa TaxID=48698 RepID=A0A096MD36_POEFO
TGFKIVSMLKSNNIINAGQKNLLITYDTLVPMNIVQTGESVTFKCALPSQFNKRDVYWYKQRPGDTLRPIVKVSFRQQKLTTHKFEPEIPDSRWEVNNDEKFSRLTLLKASYSDDGLYHCELSAWTGSIEWSGTYLMVTGKFASKISPYQLAVSNPVRPGDTADFQCSVLFDSEKMACSEDFSMFWFQAKSNNTYPNMIYTEGNKHHECEKKSDSEKSCMFNFSKVVNSSDSGIFYCAVSSCGKILFGNGTRLEIGRIFSSILENLPIWYKVCYVLGIFAHNYYLTCVTIEYNRFKHPKKMDGVYNFLADGENKNYAALNFSKSKEKRGGKKKQMEPQECFYSEIKSGTLS